jgi:hypothetical protein
MKKILFCLIIFSTSCKKVDVEIENAINLASTCDFDSRMTVGMIPSTEGLIEIRGGFATIAVNGDVSQRFIACNLPKELINGQKIVFAGEQKEFYPYEKWAGTLIKLTSLTIK